jgi:GT2 family glycosyltransferase
MTIQASRPVLSVIIPVRNAASVLRESVAALEDSDLPRATWELIIVLDAADHDCEEIAAAHADLLVRLPPPFRGPAYARNRGSEFARGEIVLFLDADIRVQHETLRSVVAAFRDHATATAVFGSYDASPPAPSVVSQYRNLLRHFQHQRSGGEVAAFWAGCGAIRRDAFMGAGMFDEWRFARPESEDIDLGRRLHARGHRIVLDRELQVTHLKRWTLRSSLLTSLRDRGLSFMRTVGGDEAPRIPTARTWLNADRSSTICTGAAALLAGSGIALHNDLMLRGAAVALLLALVAQTALYRFFIRLRGIPFGVVAIPLHVLHDLCNVVGMGIGWLLRHLVGDPHRDALTEAYAELGLQTWPPIPRRVAVAGGPRSNRTSLETGIASMVRRESVWPTTEVQPESAT